MNKQKRLQKTILWIVVGIVSVLLLTYLVFVWFFQSHYYFHTEISGKNVSCKTPQDVIDWNIREANDFLVTIHGRENVKYHIKGSDFGYAYEPSGLEESFKASQNPFLWPKSLFVPSKYELTSGITYDTTKLKASVGDLDLFDHEKTIEPKDAYVELTEDGYKVVPEVTGTTPIPEQVLELVSDAVSSGNISVALTDECYVKPNLTSESDQIVDCTKTIDKYLRGGITYKIGNETEELTSKDILNMLSILEDGITVVLDEEPIEKFVQTLATKYNTYGDKREFTTSLGDVITISGGDYGWVISKSKEKEQIMKDILSGNPVEREPVYEQTAMEPGPNDIGDTYLEIDYSNQHYYYYVDGTLTLDADIVSGRIINGNGSPDGIFKIVYCQKNAVLVGEDYSAPVNYFMPFAYNVGFHDAPWNPTFGGDYYIEHGSHGCINMKPQDAENLYNLVEKGTPVVAYYRTPVQLTSESAQISNAQSYVAP